MQSNVMYAVKTNSKMGERKKSMHFEFTIPMTSFTTDRGIKRPFSYGDLTISGVAYYFSYEHPLDQIDYDIDTVVFEGKDILPILNWMEGSAKEIEEIHDACIAHAQFLFIPDGYVNYEDNEPTPK